MEEAVEEAAAAAVAERRAQPVGKDVVAKPAGAGTSRWCRRVRCSALQAEIVSPAPETNCNWVSVFFNNWMSVS